MQFMILSTRFWRSFSLACAVLCGLSMEAPAQVHQFRNYTAADENGLSDNFVFSIQQDRQGRLWFATSAGVSSYDGVEFKTFTMRSAKFTKTVRAVCGSPRPGGSVVFRDLSLLPTPNRYSRTTRSLTGCCTIPSSGCWKTKLEIFGLLRAEAD